MSTAPYSVRGRLAVQLDEALRAASSASDAHAMVREASRPEFGDYQANGVMAIANRMGIDSRELAMRTLALLDLEQFAAKAEIAGPGFLNIRLKSEFLTDYLARDLPAVLVGAPINPERIVIDYSGPNLAKEMHIGHLRSTIIGDAMCRILEHLGHRIIRQNHVGDWGTQFGMLLHYMTVLGEDVEPELEDLEEFYRAAKERFDKDPEFARQARAAVVRLQAGEQEEMRLWRHFTAVSLAHCQAVYDRLNVGLTPADLYGESRYNADLPKVIADLRRAGLLRESNGAQCVFPEGFCGKDGEPLPLIVQKSDGGYLYATTDLATIRYCADVHRADAVLYFVDARQSLHLAQVFAVAAAAGFQTPGMRLVHEPFGMVLGKDGRPFRTRDGGVVKLDVLLTEAEERALRLVRDKNPVLPDAESRAIARIIGIGAVKYADLCRHRASNYVFDWEEMLAFEGNTAPYLQYAYTRIVSIFRNAQQSLEETVQSPSLPLDTAFERHLALVLVRFAETLETVAQENCPHFLCTYLYVLASAFSSLYEHCPILRAPADLRLARLRLCQLTAWTLRRGLDLLGIGTVERM